MPKSKPRTAGFIRMQELDAMVAKMLTKIKNVSLKVEMKTIEDQEKKKQARLVMKQEALEALNIIFLNLDPQVEGLVSFDHEYDLIRKTLEELAK